MPMSIFRLCALKVSLLNNQIGSGGLDIILAERLIDQHV